jgi:dTMP kinase
LKNNLSYSVRSPIHTKKLEVKGKLVVVEGIDGSGKSTQIRLLGKWLRSKLLPVFMTEWNSSEMVKEITSKGKKKGRLTPTTFSLLHATDFADRYERNIFPLLRAGYIVLADRYVYTAYARDIVRGCSPKWVRKVYDFAINPDAVFYFRVPVDVAVERILAGRPKLKYYEAGMDLNLSNDQYDSYRIFQSRIIEQYESMVKPEGFIIIDGTSSIEGQQQLVRKTITELLQRQRQQQQQLRQKQEKQYDQESQVVVTANN